MAMLRAFSTRRSRLGYERLLETEVLLNDIDEEDLASNSTTNTNNVNGQFEEAQLKRARSVSGRVFGLSRKFTQELALPVPVADKYQVKSTTTTTTTTKKEGNKSKNTHPLFSLFDGRRKKKTTAKPEFARYVEYIKEGGMWDMNANTPVIYYK